MEKLKAEYFHIDVEPVSISFTCPYCEDVVTIPWRELHVPACWSDDWDDVECPNCKKKVKLGEYEYD